MCESKISIELGVILLWIGRKQKRKQRSLSKK